MTTATKNEGTRRRSKPAPANVCRLSVTINGTSYAARPLRSELPEVIKAWRLRKADGTVYDIADTADGAQCTCADHVFRHEGNGTQCKHVKAMRALGLIDAEGSDPADWPTWTDHAAFTITR